MASYNRVILMGNLTRDPELRYLPSNTPVANFGMAMNRRYKNQQGEQQEEVTFVDCECFGRPAEVINQYMQKGRQLMVEGRLKLDQWQTQEGQNRSKLKVVVENFQFVDRGGDGGGGGGGGGAAGQGAQPQAQQGGPPSEPAGHEPVPEDDIPF
jgi:single-strand DNA-binding protein